MFMSKNKRSELYFYISFGIVSIALAMSAFSTFSKFIPISSEKWIDSGTGILVFVTCLLSIGLFFFKNYFATFFISLFDLFFVFNEVIVKYDLKAVELGREIQTETTPGYFRSALDIFSDVIQQKSGAWFIFLGLFVTLLFTIINWTLKVRLDNLAAMPVSEESEEKGYNYNKEEY